MQNFLRPIVEAAGYQVVDEQDEVDVDLAIVAEESPDLPGNAARVIRVRSSQVEGPGAADSIYRYDRAGLLVALKSAVGGRGQ